MKGTNKAARSVLWITLLLFYMKLSVALLILSDLQVKKVVK